MPATGFAVDSEIEGLLGRFPEALKKVSQEIAQIEKRTGALLKAGKTIPQNELRELERLRNNQGTYADKVAQQKEIEKAATEAVRKELGTSDKGGPSVKNNFHDSSALIKRYGRPTALTDKLLKEGFGKKSGGSIAEWFYEKSNVHNPHSAVANALSGNPRSLANLVERMVPGGKALAGSTGVVASAMFAIAQNLANQDEEGAKIDLNTQSERTTAARSLRFTGSESVREWMMKRKDAGTGTKSVAKLGPLAPLFIGGKHGATMRKFDQTVFDFLNEGGAGENYSEETKNNFRDVNKWKDDPAVKRQFTYTQQGLFGFLKHHTLDALTGRAEANELAAGAKRAMQVMDTQTKRKKDEVKEYYDEDPNRLVARADADASILANQRREMERRSDPNPW